MGVGLSISQEIVMRLNGRITVESELGRGSTFTVWVPAAKDEG
jgi:signal transduction histidine kinase